MRLIQDGYLIKVKGNSLYKKSLWNRVNYTFEHTKDDTICETFKRCKGLSSVEDRFNAYERYLSMEGKSKRATMTSTGVVAETDSNGVFEVFEGEQFKELLKKATKIRNNPISSKDTSKAKQKDPVISNIDAKTLQDIMIYTGKHLKSTLWIEDYLEKVLSFKELFQKNPIQMFLLKQNF